MISMNMKTFRFGAALWAIGFAGGTAAWAQEVRHVYGTSQLREDHGQTLSRHLRTLAESPRNSSALRGAGEAALSLGDPQTALTFFRSEEHTSELQSLMRISYAVFCLKKKKDKIQI